MPRGRLRGTKKDIVAEKLYDPLPSPPYSTSPRNIWHFSINSAPSSIDIPYCFHNLSHFCRWWSKPSSSRFGCFDIVGILYLKRSVHKTKLIDFFVGCDFNLECTFKSKMFTNNGFPWLPTSMNIMYQYFSPDAPKFLINALEKTTSVTIPATQQLIDHAIVQKKKLKKLEKIVKQERSLLAHQLSLLRIDLDPSLSSNMDYSPALKSVKELLSSSSK